MQLQNFSPEARSNPMLERIKSREATPEVIALELRREGDAMVTETKSEIEAARRSLQESGDQNTLTQLKALEDELDDAWDTLEGEVSGVFERRPTDATEDLDAGWDVGEASDAASEQEGDEASMGEQIDAVEAKIDELFWSEDCPLEILDEIGAEIRNNEHLKNAAYEKLSDDIYSGVGRKYTEKLFNDQGYVKELKDFRSALSEQITGTDVKLMENRSLRNLIAVKEIFGGVEKLKGILGGMDLSRYNSELDLQQDSSPIQLIEFNFDSDSGSIETLLNVQFTYNEGRGFINRNFKLAEKKDEEGHELQAKSVKHEVFKLPDHIKSNGIAAKVLESCLAGYRSAGIDTIKLHANIDVGGYAWASYGFDWDEEEMTRLKYESTAVRAAGLQNSETLSPDEKEQAKRNASAEFSSLAPEEKQEIFTNTIREFLDDCRLGFEGVCMNNGIDTDSPEFQAILREFEELIKHAEAVTPQAIAQVGRNSPLQLFKDREDNWYTQEQQQEKLNSGTATEKDFIRFHAGKIAMFGTSWYGKVHGDEQFSKIENKAKRSA